MEELVNFLNGMYKVLYSTMSFVVKGKEAELEIQPGGSYTDGKYMRIGVAEDFTELSPKIVYMLTVALIGHEGQHILSSNFDEFERYNKEEVEKLVDKGVSRRFASRYVHSIGNIIEDGRIENILVNRLPGFIPKIQYLNMFFWDKGGITEETDEFSAYISSILSLSVLGIYPKNYKLISERVNNEVDKVKNLIPKGVKARTCKEGLDVCREILAISEPFVLELYEDIKEDEEFMEELMEMLEEFLEEHHNSEEEDYNDSNNHSSHISESQNPDENSQDNEDGKEESNSSEEEEDKKEEGKSKGNDKDEEKSEDKEEKNSGNDSSKDKDDNEESKGSSDSGESKSEEESTDSDNKKETEENDSSSNSNSNSDEDRNKDDKDEENEENNDFSLSGGLEAATEDNKQTDDDITSKMEELAKDLEAEAEKDIAKNERDKARAEKNKPKDYSLSNNESNKIARSVFENKEFKETKEKFSMNKQLPEETKIAARKFKRQIRDIFDSKAMGSITEQEKGVLDTDNIFRVGMGNYNVFKTEVVKNDSEHVLFFLRDGSGSMEGEKDMTSMLSLAIMEEGLKGVVPFKAVTFNTSYFTFSNVQHTVIKDWNDNSKKNYSYNYIHNYEAQGGNVDSVSIRIAAEELLRRPEKDKTLIVLSDGQPYCTESTKQSIKDVRDKGINVIGIMFGDEDFRKHYLPMYKDMYQKNIIATSVSKIPNRLVAVLRDILKH